MPKQIIDSTPAMRAHLKQIKRECALIASGESRLSVRDQLIVTNYRFAITVASQYQGQGLDLEDLIGFAYIGLTEAADRFRPGHGVSFHAYAAYWCRKELSRAISDAGHPIRLPKMIKILSRRIQEAQNTFLLRNGREATAADLAAMLGEDEELITTLLIVTDPFESLDQLNEDVEEDDYE